MKVSQNFGTENVLVTDPWSAFVKDSLAAIAITFGGAVPPSEVYIEQRPAESLAPVLPIMEGPVTISAIRPRT